MVSKFCSENETFALKSTRIATGPASVDCRDGVDVGRRSGRRTVAAAQPRRQDGGALLARRWRRALLRPLPRRQGGGATVAHGVFHKTFIRFKVDFGLVDSHVVFGIGLRHLENYRYSNLFVFLHTKMPNGNVTHDTIECTLATPEGQWIGKSSGSMRDLLVPLNENLHFPLSGSYHFEIEQAMREPALKGISDIGLYIEKQ